MGCSKSDWSTIRLENAHVRSFKIRRVPVDLALDFQKSTNFPITYIGQIQILGTLLQRLPPVAQAILLESLLLPSSFSPYRQQSP